MPPRSQKGWSSPVVWSAFEPMLVWFVHAERKLRIEHQSLFRCSAIMLVRDAAMLRALCSWCTMQRARLSMRRAGRVHVDPSFACNGYGPSPVS